MKKLLTFLLLLIPASALIAQGPGKNITLKWAPLGLIMGNVSLQGEYNFGKNSLTAKIGVPTSAKHTFLYDGKDVAFTMKATTFMAGYRTYLSKKHMKGLYFEPYFKYVHHTSEGMGIGTLDNQEVRMNFTNDYNGAGIGAQLGAQFAIGERFIVDFFFLGPEINSAKNKFKAVEMTHTSGWNDIEANEAENDIRNFLEKFPFLKNHVNVMVDKEHRTVRTDFKGFIPGYRAGVSVGFRF